MNSKTYPDVEEYEADRLACKATDLSTSLHQCLSYLRLWYLYASTLYLHNTPFASCLSLNSLEKLVLSFTMHKYDIT